MNIFPTSPLPANFDRQKEWGDSDNFYDTGLAQATTALTKPLYTFNFNAVNMPMSQQSSLSRFEDIMKSGLTPFFIKDPYDQYDFSDGRTIVRTNQVDPSTMFFRNSNSYHYWPDSATFSGWLTSNLSGTLIFGTDYVLDQETGIVTFSLAAAANDWYSVANTVSYFKKVKFASPLRMASPKVWGQFDITVQMKELTR
jgi:hypothetical protein